MRYHIIVAFLITGMTCGAQNHPLDSITQDSLLRAGFERCAGILAHDFDTCINYSNESWSEERTCRDKSGGDSINFSGVHMGCCDFTYKYIYDDGRIIGMIQKSSEPGKRENMVTYYVGRYIVEATFEYEYEMEQLSIREIMEPGKMFGTIPATSPPLYITPR